MSPGLRLEEVALARGEPWGVEEGGGLETGRLHSCLAWRRRQFLSHERPSQVLLGKPVSPKQATFIWHLTL